METELRCGACVDAVVKNPRLLIADVGEPDPAWLIGADGKRHWARVIGEACVGGHNFSERTPLWLGVCGSRVVKG